MSDTPNERRNCWTCGHGRDAYRLKHDRGYDPETAEWLSDLLAHGEDMPPRTTPTPCPGWSPKETSDD